MAEGTTGELSRVSELDLAAYRPEHIAERIRRALERERLEDVDGLVALLRGDAAARSRFRRSVAVSVSGLFRDPSQFGLLERELLPPLVEGGRRITVWSAGCADGSELYSIAVLLERLAALDRALLVGSDLLEENLALARAGDYQGVTFAADLRARLRWERRDLLRDGALPGKWRVVLCRNLAIYLGADAKRALHRTLVSALTDDGVLMLGRSERIDDSTALGVKRVAPHVYRRVA